jgi:hypothetical protein
MPNRPSSPQLHGCPESAWGIGDLTSRLERPCQDGLQLSAAAVSVAARQLIAAGMLERVSRAGDRHTYYRMASGSWDAPLEAKLRALSRLRQVADDGIAAAGNRADYRLLEMRDAFAWFENQLDEHIKQRRHTK